MTISNDPSWFVPDWPVPARVRCLSTTRLGGVSQGRFASFNLGDHVGDDDVLLDLLVGDQFQRVRGVGRGRRAGPVGGAFLAQAGETRGDQGVEVPDDGGLLEPYLAQGFEIQPLVRVAAT